MQHPLEHTRSYHRHHCSTSPGVYAHLPHFPLPPASRTKAAIVPLWSWLLAWRPSVALVLGRLVLRMWPDFRRV